MSSTTVLNHSGSAADSRHSVRERTHQPLERIIFFAMLSLIPLTAIPYGSVQPWWIGVFECVVFALGALWLIEGLIAGTWRRHRALLLAPLLVLLLFAFVQTLPLWSAPGTPGQPQHQALSADPYQTKLWILQFGALILAAAILLRYTSDHYRLRYLVNVVIAVGVSSAIFGIFRHLAQFELPITASTPLTDFATYGQFLNRNHFALLMEMTLGLASGMILLGGLRPSQLLLYIAVAAIIWVALVLSNSRGGIFSMLGQSIFIVLAWNIIPKHPVSDQNAAAGRLVGRREILAKPATRAVLALCMATMMPLAILWVGGDRLIQRLEVLPRELNLGSSSRQNSSRLSIWRATTAMFQDHPVAGVGFGGYRTSLPAYHDAAGSWIPQEAHNDYLELMASGGIIGVALAAWFVILFCRDSWRRLTSSSDRLARASCFGALVGLLGVAIHSLVDFGLHTTINALVCFALIAIATLRIPANQVTYAAASQP